MSILGKKSLIIISHERNEMIIYRKSSIKYLFGTRCCTWETKDINDILHIAFSHLTDDISDSRVTLLVIGS